MQLEKRFEVSQPKELAAEIAARDETLVGLFPKSQTEIIERVGNRRTARSRYKALGHEGVATFHFTVGEDGNIEFEKVCDGNVWRELRGTLRFEGAGAGTSVCVALKGRARPLVPEELAIRVPMREQIERMAEALRARLEASG